MASIHPRDVNEIVSGAHVNQTPLLPLKLNVASHKDLSHKTRAERCRPPIAEGRLSVGTDRIPLPFMFDSRSFLARVLFHSNFMGACEPKRAVNAALPLDNSHWRPNCQLKEKSRPVTMKGPPTNIFIREFMREAHPLRLVLYRAAIDNGMFELIFNRPVDGIALVTPLALSSFVCKVSGNPLSRGAFVQNLRLCKHGL